MEVYILDSSLRRSEVVENFESFVWTERYSSAGDFVLEIQPVLAEQLLSTKGTLIGCDKSDRTMMIETVENTMSDDGVRVLKITGPSIEATMEKRLNDYTALGALGPAAPFNLTDTPGSMMWDMFARACITNTIVTADRMPFIQNSSYSSITGAIPSPSTPVTIQFELGTLYDSIKAIADTYRMGFRIIRVEDPSFVGVSKLYFEVYTGFDRTTLQTARNAVVFSVLLDNLTDTQELSTIEPFKNVAYVFGATASRVVYEDTTDPAVAGFDRRVLYVQASELTTNAQMDQRGKEELAKNRAVLAFDGKISQTSGLVYGSSYKLGDLVEQRSETGARTIMKVTEQIFTSDREGEKSYPTLTLDSLVTAGSWDSLPPAKVWDAYTTEVWDSM